MRRFAMASMMGWIVLGLAGATPAFAIPSPELVVGSLTSAFQLIALASALIGGGAIVGMRARRRGGGQALLSRRTLIVMAGIVVLLMVSVGFNLHQYVDAKNEQQARLEQTLLRPSRLPGGSATDPDMKELAFGEQLKHPLRISTDEAAQMLAATARGERNDLAFLDVREAAEREMGTLPGVTFVRFPDLKAANIDFTGKQAILFCHNGNRSSETCEAFQKLGIDCRFMVGGLEKWVVEGRPMTGLAARSLAELRAIPDYPNRNTLLDTSDVNRLVKDRKAMFVDIRYPTDFAEQHIAGAINLSLRRMPTPELKQKIAQLPKRPIVLPCYDRRGCFFAEVLGYELTQAGHEVLGRYTLPWEYFVPRPRPPHVQQWIEENNRSIWTKAGHHLAGAVSTVGQGTGLIGAILLLAILSRLLVLPVSMKAERDQIRARTLSSELAALKSRLKNDPRRRMRAIRAFYRRHGLTPLRNLIAPLLLLPIMVVALLAVAQTVSKTDAQFLWIKNLAERDPWLVLPVLFGAFITLYLDSAFVRTRRQRIATWAIALPLLSATAALFSAGAGLYLVASAVLLLLQRMAIAGDFARLLRAWRRRALPGRIITLDEPERLSAHGNKAHRLARMRAAGMHVPHGLLLPSDFLEEFATASSEWRRTQLDTVWRQLGEERVAVRSAAAGEDSERRSFAGVFDSVLDVDRDGLDAALLKVMASFSSERAKGYAAGGKGGILVQCMVSAEYAGVLFTRDPAAGSLAMIELVEGTAEKLVSGGVRPQTYRFGRVSGQLLGEAKPPIDLQPLLALGQKAESLFDAPQDVEWTWKAGAFHVVQSRNITSPLPPVQQSLAQALDLANGCQPEETVLAKNELCEMLPRPTPLSLSLMEALWVSGGSVDLACRALGLLYPVDEDAPDYLVTVLGRLYLNKRQERERTLHIGPFAARRLARKASDFEREFREAFLPKFLAEVRIAEAVDFDKLSTPDLFDAIEHTHSKFIHETHVDIDVVNIATHIYLSQARAILARHGLDPSTYLGHIPETSEARAFAQAEGAPREERRLLLAASIGHRAIFDYELSEPRYAENPQVLDELPPTPRSALRQGPRFAADEAALAEAGKRVVVAVDIARRFQALKEDARHHSLRELALLRRAVLALDRRLGFGGLCFYLRFDELLRLRTDARDMLRGLAEERRNERTLLLEHAPLAAMLTARDLEAISMGGEAAHEALGALIRGTRVSGSGVVVGRARVVAEADAECGRPIDDFKDGDIIVATMIHPAWLPYFGRAGGFVCEVGGWLSHTAILAREYNATMIVGASGLSAIADRDALRLHPDGTVETINNDVHCAEERPLEIFSAGSINTAATASPSA